MQPISPFSGAEAVVGGLPNKTLDVPVCAVFIALFALLAAGHMGIFQINRRRRNHKFFYSVLLFAFCMARIATCSMRIVWALNQTNLGVVIAAQVLVNAGVLILYIVNLIFAQRVLRAVHPSVGWSRVVYVMFMAMVVLLILCLAGVITTFVLSINTTNVTTIQDAHHVQMTAVVILFFFSFLPLPIVLLSLLVPARKAREDFGSGSWTAKVAVLLAGSALTCLDAGFRTGVLLSSPRPATAPAWYDAKWCFYFFNFTLEVLVVGLYLFARVDRRFWVPDGSKRPGDYHMLS